MIYVLYGISALGAWLLFGYLWCTLFVDDNEDEEDKHQECPYD